MFIRNLFYGLAIVGFSTIIACDNQNILVEDNSRTRQQEEFVLTNFDRDDRFDKAKEKLPKQFDHFYFFRWHEDEDHKFDVYDKSWLILKLRYNDIEKVRVRWLPHEVIVNNNINVSPSIGSDESAIDFYPDKKNRVVIPFSVTQTKQFNIKAALIFKNRPLNLQYHKFIFNKN